MILLDNERATYGKKIVVTLSQQLQNQYGSAFERTNCSKNDEACKPNL